MNIIRWLFLDMVMLGSSILLIATSLIRGSAK